MEHILWESQDRVKSGDHLKAQEKKTTCGQIHV